MSGARQAKQKTFSVFQHDAFSTLKLGGPGGTVWNPMNSIITNVFYFVNTGIVQNCFDEDNPFRKTSAIQKCEAQHARHHTQHTTPPTQHAAHNTQRTALDARSTTPHTTRNTHAHNTQHTTHNTQTQRQPLAAHQPVCPWPFPTTGRRQPCRPARQSAFALRPALRSHRRCRPSGPGTRGSAGIVA